VPVGLTPADTAELARMNDDDDDIGIDSMDELDLTAAAAAAQWRHACMQIDRCLTRTPTSALSSRQH